METTETGNRETKPKYKVVELRLAPESDTNGDPLFVAVVHLKTDSYRLACFECMRHRFTVVRTETEKDPLFRSLDLQWFDFWEKVENWLARRLRHP